MKATGSKAVYDDIGKEPILQFKIKVQRRIIIYRVVKSPISNTCTGIYCSGSMERKPLQKVSNTTQVIITYIQYNHTV